MITLITLNYNDFESTTSFIENVKNMECLDKILVVDNNSSDGSYDKLCIYKNDKIHVIKSDKNRGYGAGNNYGIKYAISHWNSDFIIISNPDVVFSENVVKKIIQCMIQNSDIAICSATMVDSKERIYTNFASDLPKYSDLILSCFQGIVQFRNKIMHHSEYPSYSRIKDKDVFYTDVVPGSFFVARRTPMEDVGFFDEKTFLYYEENILAYKLKQNGYKEAILPSEKYYHLHSVSIDKNIKKHFTRSKIMLNSAKVYLSIIGTNKFNICIYELLYWIGFPERFIFSKLSKIIKKIGGG